MFGKKRNLLLAVVIMTNGLMTSSLIASDNLHEYESQSYLGSLNQDKKSPLPQFKSIVSDGVVVGWAYSGHKIIDDLESSIWRKTLPEEYKLVKKTSYNYADLVEKLEGQHQNWEKLIVEFDKAKNGWEDTEALVKYPRKIGGVSVMKTVYGRVKHSPDVKRANELKEIIEREKVISDKTEIAARKALTASEDATRVFEEGKVAVLNGTKLATKDSNKIKKSLMLTKQARRIFSTIGVLAGVEFLARVGLVMIDDRYTDPVPGALYIKTINYILD